MKQREFNWLISSMRGWRKIDAGRGRTKLVAPAGEILINTANPEQLASAEIDWHDDEYWAILFRDFPAGTRLTCTGADDNPYQLCMHDTDAPEPRVCQPGKTAGQAVALAWLAWRTATILRTEAAGKFVQGGTDAVN